MPTPVPLHVAPACAANSVCFLKHHRACACRYRWSQLAACRRVFEEKTSRRARGDARDEAKKAEKGGHEVCEHGIIKCRICNPPTNKANHRGQAAPHRGGDESD